MRLTPTCLIVALPLFTPLHPALAQQAPPPANTATNRATALLMPEIVVTATRDAREPIDAPYAVSVLPGTQLRLEQAVRTVPEALRDEPSVMVQKTGHGQGSPYIRGFTGYRNLFLIDGVRLNNAAFRDGPNQYWNTVDAYGLSRIELVRGPASALYGSGAIGGAVNAITRGTANLRPGSEWDTTLYTRYASAENSLISRAETIGFLTDQLGLTVGFTGKRFGDLEGGRDVGTQEKTGYDELDWDAKLEYFLADDAWLVLSHQGVRIDDAWRTHKTIYGIDWEGLSVGTELRRTLDQERELTLLQFHQLNGNGAVEEIHASLSYQRQAETQERDRTNARYDDQGFDVGTLGTFVSFKSPSRAGDWVYGLEWYHDDVNSCANTLNADGSIKSTSIQGPVADDATYDTLGAYVQDEVALGERWTLLLGGRYDFAKADAERVEDPLTGDPISVEGDWDDLTANARLRYALDADGRAMLFAGVAQGFRAPNLSDLTRFDTARTDEIETPSPDLDSEKFLSFEMGIKASTLRCSAQLVGYHTLTDGMIVRTPTGRVIDDAYEVTKKNSGDGFVQGIELDGHVLLWQELSLFGVFSWMDGEVDTYPTSEALLVTEPIDRLMPPTGLLGLRWDDVRNFWVEGIVRGAAKADTLSSSDQADTSRIPPGGTPSYVVADIRTGWLCTDNLTLSLSVENITNEDYRIHGSGVNEPGRNLVLAAEWIF